MTGPFPEFLQTAAVNDFEIGDRRLYPGMPETSSREKKQKNNNIQISSKGIFEV